MSQIIIGSALPDLSLTQTDTGKFQITVPALPSVFTFDAQGARNCPTLSLVRIDGFNFITPPWGEGARRLGPKLNYTPAIEAIVNFADRKAERERAVRRAEDRIAEAQSALEQARRDLEAL